MVEYNKNELRFRAVVPADGLTIDTVEKDKRIVGFVARLTIEEFNKLNTLMKGDELILKVVSQ